MQKGLVGFWSFDGPDMAGNIAYDRGGTTTEDGTLTNGPVRTAGKIGQALDFDRTDDYVTAGDINALDGITMLTAAAWVRTENGFDLEAHIMGETACDGLNNGPFELLINFTGAGKSELYIFSPSGAETSGAGTTNINDGAWHHVVGVDDSRSIMIYDDGKQENFFEAANRTLGADSTNNFEIGEQCNGAGTNKRWKGSIDEVRVYNRVLSPDEITRLYNLGR